MSSLLSKEFAFITIFIFIGLSISPVIGWSSGNKFIGQTLENIEFRPLNKHVENEVLKELGKETATNAWMQVIGDYPYGEMNNGFNNSHNVAIRGKTKFNVDNNEYLFLGTGNVITSPFDSEMIMSIITKFIRIGIFPFNQLFLNFLVIQIEKYFKKVDTQGCELWYYDGLNWKQSVGNSIDAIISRGFENENNMELTMLIPYKPPLDNKTYLYSGTFNPRDGLEVWRTSDPINGTWEPLIYKDGEGIFSSGFGNKNNHAAYSAAILNNWLYIGTMNWRNGCEIWRTDGVIWEKIVGSECNISNGFGDDNKGFERDIYAWEMKVFQDNVSNQLFLYVGTFNLAGCELWRTSDGTNWTCLVGKTGELNRGFKIAKFPLRTHNYGVRRLEVFNNSLFIGTASVPPFGLRTNGKNRFLINVLLESMGTGCEIWRFDGSKLKCIIGRKLSFDKNKHSGFGDWTNAYVWSLRAFDNHLFAGTWNPGRFLINISFQLSYPLINVSLTTEQSQHTHGAGCEVWYTSDGVDWYQIVGDELNKKYSQWPGNGFGDINNIGARAFIVYQNCLYLGITNTVDGCELWKFDGSSYPN